MAHAARGVAVGMEELLAGVHDDICPRLAAGCFEEQLSPFSVGGRDRLRRDSFAGDWIYFSTRYPSDMLFADVLPRVHEKKEE